jgi:exodeoxyribonuclease V alpha subunit
MDKFGITYTLCAPTGAAKVRLAELTGRLAHTLHMYFQFNTPFDRNLETDYIIIDESSMIDNYLLWMVIKRIYPGQRIIFIGDADQLPPINPGEPLLQMIEAGIPTSWLTKIYRNDGGIVRAAKKILAGEIPGSDDNFMVIRETEGSLRKRIVLAINWLMSKKEAPFENVQEFSFDDIQVLTPLNKGPAGRHELNPFLQHEFNPGDTIDGTKFRANDRVVHSKNNYGLGVMNGEIGKVIGAPDKQDPFALEDVLLEVNFETQDGIIEYTKDDLEELYLAFASTIHKFQGAQKEAIILVMPPTALSFYMKQLPYTGITRAKKFCIVMNVGNAFEQYIRSKVTTRRNDLLGYFLAEKGMRNA